MYGFPLLVVAFCGVVLVFAAAFAPEDWYRRAFLNGASVALSLVAIVFSLLALCGVH